MFFLEKLCRICVQTGVPLVNINSVDFDSIRLSEKLEVFVKMVIYKNSISTDICENCVNQLRISYHFYNMCRKSTNILQGYVEKLTGTENTKHQNFDSSDLTVDIKKIPEPKFAKYVQVSVKDSDSEPQNFVQRCSDYKSRSSRRKQRITKEKRCSLLQQLLNGPKKERDKPVYSKKAYSYNRGGLENIINFTRNYKFSITLDQNSNIESTPLDKLTAFSTNYFRRDFTDFRTHVLYVIENRDKFENNSVYGSDDEDYISESEGFPTGEDRNHSENLTVDPDIKIKKEISDCEEEESQCPLDYLETTFEEPSIKTEEPSDSENDNVDQPMSIIENSNICFSSIKEKNHQSQLIFTSGSDLPSSQFRHSFGLDSSPSVNLLGELVASFPKVSTKAFSPSNVRCRTRDQPYINPMLKEQFLYRSFKCERCNRYFKSQGYLKAHTSKVH